MTRPHAEMSAARFGAVMAALWAAHDLADYVAQTDHQAANKASDWRAMAGHVGGYHVVQALTVAALRGAGVRPSWRRVLVALLWPAATHALLDRRWPVKRILTATGSPEFAQATTPLHGGYLADQALHHAALVVSAAVLAGGGERG